MEIKIKYFSDDPIVLEDIEEGDWIDLPLQDNYRFNRSDYNLVPLGVAMQLPSGYEAQIVPRSSTFKHYGLIQTNGLGVVDNSYNGPNDEWFWSSYALEEKVKGRWMSKGTRLCQFRIIKKQPTVVFKVSTLEHNADRGGHGSTGK